MGKLESNKLQKRTSLLNTAFNLFTTKGVSKTSIAEISKNAGIAKGTFYLYFKDNIPHHTPGNMGKRGNDRLTAWMSVLAWKTAVGCG